MDAAREARRALNRLNRAIEKAESELAAVTGALRYAEGDDFPADEFDAVSDHLRSVTRFVEEQEQRLQEKILYSGGIEAGRVRRST